MKENVNRFLEKAAADQTLAEKLGHCKSSISHSLSHSLRNTGSN